jgi:hypothetical protein
MKKHVAITTTPNRSGVSPILFTLLLILIAASVEAQRREKRVAHIVGICRTPELALCLISMGRLAATDSEREDIAKGITQAIIENPHKKQWFSTPYYREMFLKMGNAAMSDTAISSIATAISKIVTCNSQGQHCFKKRSCHSMLEGMHTRAVDISIKNNIAQLWQVIASHRHASHYHVHGRGFIFLRLP